MGGIAGLVSGRIRPVLQNHPAAIRHGSSGALRDADDMCGLACLAGRIRNVDDCERVSAMDAVGQPRLDPPRQLLATKQNSKRTWGRRMWLRG